MGASASINTFGKFTFTEKDFQRVRGLVSQHTGISLSEAKKDMVYSRLAKRVRELGLASFADYLAYLDGVDADDELVSFTNAITTNLTAFFRENHHFDYLARVVLPELIQKNAKEKKLRIWCCAASTGEEPYSIAMVVDEMLPKERGWDVKILATDIDTHVLGVAKKGVYRQDQIKDVLQHRKERYFLKGKNANTGYVCVSPVLKNRIVFKPLNLMHTWPIKGPIDVIFCRNVVIYFTKETKKLLINQFADLMEEGDYLFMGHSEALHDISDKFSSLGQTIYRRRA